MPIFETVAISIGSSIAKSILKIWLKDESVSLDASSSIIDIIKSKTSDKITQRRAKRQFEAIGEKVGESLLPIFEIEDNLDEDSKVAVALAVAEVLNTASLPSELLVQHDLEPSKLASYLLANRSQSQLFSEKERILYERIISESCEYIIDIASQLPTFTERTFAEVLKREGQLLDVAEQILQEVQHMSNQLDLQVQASRFELEYRRAVVRNMDVLQLFGADVSITSRRHRLSVAYVTLSVTRVSQNSYHSNGKLFVPAAKNRHIDNNKNDQDIEREKSKDVIPVDQALASAHSLLILGPAGSGKTTLLQWIAVSSASQSFKGPLAHWNNSIPFYIRLRHCWTLGMPTPESFPGLVATSMADIVPKGWVHSQLISGKAIVLVDGLDEVPDVQREDVHTWLRDLVGAYPKGRFIVTSRPHVAKEDWINLSGFSDAEMLPMELSDINAFIDHWYRAVAEELHDAEEKAELPYLATSLKNVVLYDHSKRSLATNPLLCAMLCALNRQRRQHLPSDRIELYESCCNILIERRDKERRVPLVDYPALALTYRQKRVLLEDLAYWLIKNGWSEVSFRDVDKRFAKKLTHMENVARDIDGSDVRQLFIERTGIIREPLQDCVDFAHRTFQEFLAAKAIVDEGDIGVLIQNAYNDQWREVIILAAGLAPRKECEELIQGIIACSKQGMLMKRTILNKNSPRFRLSNNSNAHQMQLLAVSCLETSVVLSRDVKLEIQEILRKLVPPQTIAEAIVLASAGQAVINYLAKKDVYSASISANCIKTLALIGGNDAINILEGFTSSNDVQVVSELWSSWDYFDKISYAKRILSKLTYSPFLTKIDSLKGFEYCSGLKSLSLSCAQIKDLSPLASLKELTSLNLVDCRTIKDLSPLASLKELTSLSLANCEAIKDLSPLASLKELTSLSLVGCGSIADLGPLASLSKLTSLYLMGCGSIADLGPLASLSRLTLLDLSYCKTIKDLAPLASLTELTSLDLKGCASANISLDNRTNVKF